MKKRYRIQPFSPDIMGIWDEQIKNFVNNPESGRRKLFYKSENAQKLADKLNADEDSHEEAQS
jgi:hypothetical protein